MSPRLNDPYLSVKFFYGPRGVASLTYFDGHETRSNSVSMKQDQVYVRLQEAVNNALRSILNNLEQERKRQKETSSNE